MTTNNQLQSISEFPDAKLVSSRWTAFKKIYAANWHRIKDDADEADLYLEFVVRCDEKILRQALTNLASYGLERAPKLWLMKREYWRLWNEQRTIATREYDCHICNGELNVSVVEVFCDDSWQLIKPGTPVTAWTSTTICAATAPCVCQGGSRSAAHNRWEPICDGYGNVIETPYTAATNYVKSCVEVGRGK